MLHRHLSLAFALAALFAIGSERAGTAAAAAAPAAAGGQKYQIAMIPKGTTHEFWKSVHAGGVKAAREAGVELIWKGPLKEDDRESQIATVEGFIDRKVSGIVLAPLDDTALRAPVSAAVKAGIPVVIIDSGLKSEDFVSFVATDNYKGGQIGGEYLAKQLGGKGKVVLLRYQEGSASTAEREKGFLDAMKKANIEVVSSNQYGGATTETAYKASENLLAPLTSGDKLTVDGIFCPNESTTFGMLRALQEGGFAGKVHFVGFDSSAKLVEALGNGQIDGLVLQNPFNMGYLGIKTMIDKLNGKEVPKRIDTGAQLISKANMNEPDKKQLLTPDLKEWLGQ